jgi:glycosyltransferase involved in cell wall biosynthesis
MHSLATTCLINNYNYAEFVGAAVASALAQTVPFDQIVVVDDGSTDASLEVLDSLRARHPAVQVIAKENRGQLSCFNEGAAHATGDVVFFLDADDVYEPTYVEHALRLYAREPACDFVACGHREFGLRDRLRLRSAANRDLGYSVVLTALLHEWIGAPTSCLSMRRSVLERILPLPFCDDWRTRADDCLVFGASLAGARKLYLAQPLVRYRVHGANRFCGRANDKHATYRRRLAINRLFEHLERKFSYNVSRLADFHHREFCTIANPTLRQFMQYVRISMAARTSTLRRIACLAEMARHLLQTALARRQQASDAEAAREGAAATLRMFVPDERAQAAEIQPQRRAA